MLSTTTLLTNGDTAVQTLGHSDKPSLLSVDAFYADLPSQHVAPLWLHMESFVTPKPTPAAVPEIWRYREILPSLMRAGELVSAEKAERRVLMLVNPALKAPCTTDTIYGGLQLVLPNETAPAHRHTAFALCFIIEGSRGFTAVQGKKIMMERGDIILTPSFEWHDHGNEGTDPVIWLDGLDLPLFQLYKLNFASAYPEKRYPSSLSDNSNAVFKWAPVERALREQAGPYSRYEYRHSDGSHLSRTLSAQAERLGTQQSSPESQQTLSFMYHVVKGKGYSSILTPGMSRPKVISWSSKDTFVVPAWSKVIHTSRSEEGDTFLVAINDLPMVEALGLWRNAATFSTEVES